MLAYSKPGSIFVRLVHKFTTSTPNTEFRLMGCRSTAKERRNYTSQRPISPEKFSRKWVRKGSTNRTLTVNSFNRRHVKHLSSVGCHDIVNASTRRRHRHGAKRRRSANCLLMLLLLLLKPDINAIQKSLNYEDVIGSRRAAHSRLGLPTIRVAL